jgi:hypothetical protein
MLEVSRLKPMAPDYDEQLFNRLYSETKPLRIKLAKGIDCRRFGLFFDDILSFFDVKFIFVFNKHYNEPPEKLKAFIINALTNFKQRILRAAYTMKFSQNIVSFEEICTNEDFVEEKSYRDHYYEKMMTFMRCKLSDNAYTLLEVQLNPPPYILRKINPGKDKGLQKIPDHVLLEYFDLGQGVNAYKLLGRLRKEIRQAIHQAKAELN